ncbi:hypothetical protein KR009_001362, partial [Drosophila setifemur]
ISNIGAFISLLKCVVGTGMLALPLAFSYSGIVLGIVLSILIALMLIHGMQLLIGCMVESARRQQMGYCTFPCAMEYSFQQGPKVFRKISKAGGYIVDGTLCLSHYGVCVVYLVFAAVNVQQIFAQHVGDYDVRIFVAIVGLCCIPLFLIRSLKWLVPFNFAANLFVYLGFACIFYYLFTGLPPITDRGVIYGDIALLPLFFGIILFSLTSVGVMLAIEAKMLHPEKYLGWFGILNIGVLVVLTSNIIFGIMGYWRFGSDVLGSVTLNLPSDEVVSQIAKALIAVAIFLTYPLSGYVVVDIVMNHCWNKSGEMKHPKLKETIFRVCFVLVTTLNAVIFPNLGPLLSLVGAFTISLLNLCFPALIEICLLYPPEFNYGKWRWRLYKDIALAFIGFAILIQGSIYAIIEMANEWGFQKTTNPPTEAATSLTTLATAAAAVEGL